MTDSPTTETSPVDARRARRRFTRGADRRTGYGNVRQFPSGRWQARYTDSDGTRRPAPRTFATRREAEDWITTHRASHITGAWRSPDLGSATLADYLAEYLAGRVDLAPTTREKYDRLTRDWLCSALTHPTGRTINLGHIELRNLTPAHVREWHAAAVAGAQIRAAERIVATERRRSHRTQRAARQWARANGYTVAQVGSVPRAVVAAWRASDDAAASTFNLPPSDPPRDAGRNRIADAYRLLRAALNVAHRDGLITASPCTLPGAGMVRAAERPIATPDEVATIAEHMPARYAAAVIIAAWSGLRGGELFGLTRAHVDTARGTLRVERALVEVTGQPVRFGPPKTTSSIRTVHLPAPVTAILVEHLATFSATGPDALVFATDTGAPLTRGDRSRYFRQACDGLGLHRLRWHDLRHTGATYAAQAGASVRELQARLGHSTSSAAMRYQHATAERDRLLAERMAQAVPVPAVVTRLRIAR